MARIGVLALQGDFAAHAQSLARQGVAPIEVRHAAELDLLDGLVLPGGESTAMLRLMDGEPWFAALQRFHRRGGALLATCAGAILLAREVLDPRQASAAVLDATLRRNGWGRQAESFEADLDGGPEVGRRRVFFIRAPRIERVGPSVETLAHWSGEPVLLREGAVLAATFHSELGDDGWLHRGFLDLAKGKRDARSAPAAHMGLAGETTC
jgi:5'-phosphate synthase pdxT subunit